MLLDFLNTIFLDNTLRKYAWLLGTIIFVILFKKYISRVISLLLFRLVQRTQAGKMTEDFLALTLKPIEYLIILNTIYFGFSTLKYPEKWKIEFGGIALQYFILGFYKLLLILAFAFLFSRVAEFITRVLKHRAAQTDDPWDDQLVIFLRDVFKVIIWCIACFCALSIVFHVNLASLLAGAGIAGLALAFAAQESLQNIFGSIAIFSEKPFVIGDLISVDGITGKVIKVGFRSTRIRTLDTGYMTIPNKIIVNNKLENLTRRASRRIQFILGIAYSTTKQQMESLIADLKAYGENHPKRNDETSVAFYNFGAYALEIWIEMHLNYEEWETYLQTRNEALFALYGIIEKNQVKIAYPTQVVKIESDERAIRN
jgi:MscS family membrane protein